jgi:hypothetical protein
MCRLKYQVLALFFASILWVVFPLEYSHGLYDNDTDYLMSVPGMADKIKDGLNRPLSDCVPLSKVWSDV